MANERERLGEWDFVFCMIWNVQCNIVTSAGGLQCLEMPMGLCILWILSGHRLRIESQEQENEYLAKVSNVKGKRKTIGSDWS